MFPSAFYSEAEFDKRAVVVALAIDKDGDMYELNGITAIPTSSVELNSNVDIISGKGKSIGEAINQISLDVGKKVSLAHCDTLVVNQQLMQEEDLSKTLNYFLRGSQLTSNTLLIAVEEKSKDFLEAVMQSKSVNTVLISDLVNNQDSLVSASRVNIKGFFNEYYSEGSTSIMNSLQVQENTEQNNQSSEGSSGGDTSEGESSSSGSGGNTAQGKKTVKNEGNLLVLKTGKSVGMLKDKQAQAYNLYNTKIHRGFLMLRELEDDGVKKENVGIEIVQKNVNNKYSLKDGVPTLTIKCDMIVKLTEMIVDEEKKDLTHLNGVKTHITDNVKKAIYEYYKEGIDGIIELSKEQKVDIFRFKEKLYKFKNKEWKKYYDGLENKEDYLNNIVVNLELEIKGKF